MAVTVSTLRNISTAALFEVASNFGDGGKLLKTGKNAVTGLASAMVSAYSQLDVPGYVVIVDRASQLLADEEPAAFDEMLGLFGRVAAHWAERWPRASGGTGRAGRSTSCSRSPPSTVRRC